MSGIDEKTPLEEVAAIVSEALRRHDMDAVLTGGAVVSIYTDGRYESFDLDFVIPGIEKNVAEVMRGLGFHREGRHWAHPRTDFYVEFPPGPVAIGRRRLDRFADKTLPAGTLRLLTPTQSVMDRLAAFFHWNDQPSLEQALQVARRHDVDLEAIRAWAAEEDMTEKLVVFLRRLRSAEGS